MSGKSSATLSVEEIMTPESVLKTVTPEDTVLAAMELMIDNNFRHVPVVRSLLRRPWRRRAHKHVASLAALTAAQTLPTLLARFWSRSCVENVPCIHVFLAGAKPSRLILAIAGLRNHECRGSERHPVYAELLMASLQLAAGRWPQLPRHGQHS